MIHESHAESLDLQRNFKDVICSLCLCPDCESARCNTLSLVDCDWILDRNNFFTCQSTLCQCTLDGDNGLLV